VQRGIERRRSGSVQDRPKRAKTSYDTDFFAWTQEQARLLRAGKLAEIDLVNVAEEVRSLGSSEKREIRNRLTILIAHLLKWKYQPGVRSPSWQRAVREQRDSISELIADSPSLRSYPRSVAHKRYDAARLAASAETGIDFTLFPEDCPFTAEQILDPDFLPVEPDRYDPS
jgi:hypothetical protein